MVNVARMEKGRATAPGALPGDVMSDLHDSFNYYDKSGCDVISTEQFKNILHNFGFHKENKKVMD